MLEHKEELGFIISMFKVAVTKYGFMLNQEQQKYLITGVTQGIACSKGKRQRDPFRANNSEFIYGFAFMHRAQIVHILHLFLLFLITQTLIWRKHSKILPHFNLIQKEGM